MTVPVEENVVLAPFTTLGVGGPTRYFARIRQQQDLAAALDWAESRQLEIFILGGGSNVLVADAGFAGLTLRMEIAGRDIDGDEVELGAGENWDGFVAWCVERNLGGVECMSGIPGTVGATPIQNVGAYGQEVAETITRVRVWDRRRRAAVNLSRAECHFRYRRSMFNEAEAGRYVVLAVSFAPRAGGAPTIRHGELEQRLAERPESKTLAETRQAVLAIRREKAMLIEPGQAESRSAGSFFKNPVVDVATWQRIGVLAAEAPPRFAAEDGRVKIPAAWLIEKAGFHKGYRPTAGAPAGISRRHALALVNYGGARADDLVRLKQEIAAGVAERFDVRLEYEPVLIGFDPGPAHG